VQTSGTKTAMGIVENRCAPYVSLHVNTPRGEQSSRCQLALTSNERNGIVSNQGDLIIRVAEVDRQRKTCTECFNFMEFTCASRCEIHIINALSAGLPLSIHVFLPLENIAGWARSLSICGRTRRTVWRVPEVRNAPSEAPPHSIILQHTHTGSKPVSHCTTCWLITYSKRERNVHYETTTNRGKRR